MAMRLDFTNKDYFRDSAARLEALRAAGPVVEVKFPIVGKVWVTTTYEAAGRVLKDNQTSLCARRAALLPGFAGGCRASSARSSTICSPWTSRTTPGCAALSTKPSAAAPFSTWSRASSPSPTSSQTTCSPKEARPISSIATRRLPLAVICELLGLPQTDRAKFMAWANTAGRIRGPFSFWRALRVYCAMRPYLEERLQIAREHGGEGLIAELVRVENEGGRISGEEMVAMVFLLLGAGSETTTH